MPAGKIDAGETVIQAARRELFEETGLTMRGEGVIIGNVFPSCGIIDECHAVVCCWTEGEPNTDNTTDHEDIELLMLDGQDLENLVRLGKIENKRVEEPVYLSLGLTHYAMGVRQAQFLTKAI